jgi:leucyl-tRNA synthetase
MCCIPWDLIVLDLPAEQYAIKTGKNPGPFTNQLVKRYTEQLSILGFSYDWDRQVATHDPEYYRWTQWIFLQIYNSWYDRSKNKARPITDLEKEFVKNGNEQVNAVCDQNTPTFSKTDWKSFSDLEKQNMLMKYRLAYEGYAEVNWCAEMGTVLANDEVIEVDGKMVSERGEFPVEKKSMRQWFMRITAYADRLIEGLETIDWSNSIKEIQKNWIGKSEGSEINFSIKNSNQKITVFTTRADTLFGVTYVVLAPEHDLVQQLKSHIKNWSDVEKYIASVKSKSDEDRTAAKEKTGIQLQGIFAVNPANDEQVPVWIADYVLAGYGTGAVMAVPAHDERDFEFANKFGLPIKQVIARPAQEKPQSEILRRDGVVCIVKNKDGKILILQKEGGEEYLFPQGGIEKGEVPLESAIREIREESGYSDIRFIAELGNHENYFEMKEGTRHRITHTFLFDLVSDENKGLDLDVDEINFISHWVDPLEALNLINTRNHKLFLEIYLNNIPQCFSGEGILTNSDKFDNLTSQDAKQKITEFVGGRMVTKYKFRDAIFARQRYWGEPIPLIHQKVKPKVVIKFDYQKTWSALIDGTKTIETRALNPHEKKNYFGDVEIGDIVMFLNKKTKEEKYVQITNKYIWKSFEQLFKDPLLESVCSDKDWYKNLKSVDELKNSYNFNSEYISLIEKYGLVGWSFKFIDPNIIKTVPNKQLPLELPKVKSYAPSGNGEGPLATVKSWVDAGYETNTMPGWAGSSWYFLRYIDAHNKKAFADDIELDYWFGKKGGVDMYVGGQEHATGHLLYSRFWHKVLHDLGYVKTDEPFKKLRNQGMILAEDGRKMSKRWGNVINPDDVVAQFGADTMRVYEMFMGPFEASQPWNTDSMVGARRFIERIWRFQEKLVDTKVTTAEYKEFEKVLHKTIKKVTDDIAEFSFNTAVSAMMIFANEAEKHPEIYKQDFKKFIQILAPFAPYIADEIWNNLGEKKSIHISDWPKYQPKLIIDDTVTIGVQINGKVRAEITINKDISESDLRTQVENLPEVQKWIDGKEIRKFIYVQGRIINIVV